MGCSMQIVSGSWWSMQMEQASSTTWSSSGMSHTISQQSVVRGKEEGCQELRTSCQDGHGFKGACTSITTFSFLVTWVFHQCLLLQNILIYRLCTIMSDASMMLNAGSSCYCALCCSKCFLTSTYWLVSLTLSFSYSSSNSAYLLQVCISLVWSPREQIECADSILANVEGLSNIREPKICQPFIYKRVATPRWTWSVSITV